MGSYYTFTIIKSTRLKMAAAPERGGGILLSWRKIRQKEIICRKIAAYEISAHANSIKTNLKLRVNPYCQLAQTHYGRCACAG